MAANLWLLMGFFFFQILEAAHKIGASDMMKHALKLIVRHFPKVRLQYGVVGWSA